MTVGDGRPSLPGEDAGSSAARLERALRQEARLFVSRARRSGARVSYRPRRGIHGGAQAAGALASALRWGFFGPVPERPARWRHVTPSPTGDAWGFRFARVGGPSGLLRLTFTNGRLRASGSGDIAVRTPSGGRVRTGLPFALGRR